MKLPLNLVSRANCCAVVVVLSAFPHSPADIRDAVQFCHFDFSRPLLAIVSGTTTHCIPSSQASALVCVLASARVCVCASLSVCLYDSGFNQPTDSGQAPAFEYCKVCKILRKKKLKTKIKLKEHARFATKSY